MTPTPAQRQVIETTEGPLLVIAGPGSGKTATLVERIVHLVTRLNVPADHILVSTFTEKAARELITRVSARLADEGVRVNLDEMMIGTIHSICLRILDEFRLHTSLQRNYRVFDQFQQQYLLWRRLSLFSDVEGFAELCGPETSGRWNRASQLQYWLNLAAEEMLSPDSLATDEEVAIRALGECLDHYQQLMRAENALDFSTIQLETLRLLQSNPEILSQIRVRVRYMMIDEYQDTNTIQEALIFLLGGEERNICVVGDDDQSIYRFRGATVRNILEFAERIGRSCPRVELTINFRSHPDIVGTYNRWMELQEWSDGDVRFRFNKRIVPREDQFHEGPTALSLVADGGPDDWNERVLKFLRFLRDDDVIEDWSQVALLVNSVRNKHVVSLAEFLENHGIGVYSPRSAQYFEREEVRLMIGALLTMFPAVWEILSKPRDDGEDWRYLSYFQESCVGLLARCLREDATNRALLEWLAEKAREHTIAIENNQEIRENFSRLFYQLLQFPLFSRYLDEGSTGDAVESREARNLARFSQILGQYEYLHNINTLRPEYALNDLRRLFHDYLVFLYDGGIEEFEDPEELTPRGYVSFFTIHQSKGLEFPVVLVGSLWNRPSGGRPGYLRQLEERYFSRPRYEPENLISEFDFRRLYYVALSRARNLLVMTGHHHRGRGGWPSPSKQFVPFVQALPSFADVQQSLTSLRADAPNVSALKGRYSYTTHVTFFEGCARQYKFFRFLGFNPVREANMIFGTLVHQTIEDMHRAAIEGRARDITTENVTDWFNANYHHLSVANKSWLRRETVAKALDHVLTYRAWNEDGWDRIQRAEVDVSIVKEDYILAGTVDLVEGETPGTVDLVDFKAEAKPDVNDPIDRARLEQYRRQLDLYAHIVAEREGVEVRRTHVHYTSEKEGVPRISWRVTPARQAETLEAIDGVIKQIRERDFRLPARPVTRCRRCDLLMYCDARDA